LIPPWCKTAADAKKLTSGTMICRSETVAEKPSFSSHLCRYPGGTPLLVALPTPLIMDEYRGRQSLRPKVSRDDSTQKPDFLGLWRGFLANRFPNINSQYPAFHG
jgi:hypothetical protein